MKIELQLGMLPVNYIIVFDALILAAFDDYSSTFQTQIPTAINESSWNFRPAFQENDMLISIAQKCIT